MNSQPSITNRLRVGVWFDQHPTLGGGYQQALTATRDFFSIVGELCDVTVYVTSVENAKIMSEFGATVRLIKLNALRKIMLKMHSLVGPILTYLNLPNWLRLNYVERIINGAKIDLVYFVSPCPVAKNLRETNFIFTVWDLCHREMPEFPEIRQGDQFRKREALLKEILPLAIAVVVDSEWNKTAISRWYGVQIERIISMPFSPPRHLSEGAMIDKSGGALTLDGQSRIDLKKPYIFYPAQFWSHKNHVYILHGIKILNEKFNKKCNVIFCGADKGNKKYIESVSRQLGIETMVEFFGFVTDTEMSELYVNSLALVMPTYFGPTNLPPLEAFALGVPLLYSDLPGMKEEVQGAALLLDLTNPESLALQLTRLMDEPALRTTLIEAGREKLRENEQSVAAGLEIFRTHLQGIAQKRICWPL
jgi:glycosyltransferase involved in cell wall biosynthesis